MNLEANFTPPSLQTRTQPSCQLDFSLVYPTQRTQPCCTGRLTSKTISQIRGCCFKPLNCGHLLGSDRKLKFIPSSPSSSCQELGSGPNLRLPSLAFTVCHQGQKTPLCRPPPDSTCTRTQCQGRCVVFCQMKYLSPILCLMGPTTP